MADVPKAADFIRDLVTEVKVSSKTTYGKNELVLFIEEQYSLFLERYIKSINEGVI